MMKRAIEKNLVSIGNDSALKYTTTTKHVYNGLTHQHQRVSNMSIYEKIMFVNFNRLSVSMSHTSPVLSILQTFSPKK